MDRVYVNRRSATLKFLGSWYGALKVFEIFFELNMALIILIASEEIIEVFSYDGVFWQMYVFIAFIVLNLVIICCRVKYRFDLRILMFCDLMMIIGSSILSYVSKLQIKRNNKYPDLLYLYMPLPCIFPLTADVFFTFKRFMEKRRIKRYAVTTPGQNNSDSSDTGSSQRESSPEVDETTQSEILTDSVSVINGTNFMSSPSYISQHFRTLVPTSLSCREITAPLLRKPHSPILGDYLSDKPLKSILKPAQVDAHTTVKSPRKVQIKVPEDDQSYREYQSKPRKAITELPDRKFTFDVRTDNGSIMTLMKEFSQVSAESLKITTVIEILTYDYLYIVQTKETFINKLEELDIDSVLADPEQEGTAV